MNEIININVIVSDSKVTLSSIDCQYWAGPTNEMENRSKYYELTMT